MNLLPMWLMHGIFKMDEAPHLPDKYILTPVSPIERYLLQALDCIAPYPSCGFGAFVWLSLTFLTFSGESLGNVACASPDSLRYKAAVSSWML